MRVESTTKAAEETPPIPKLARKTTGSVVRFAGMPSIARSRIKVLRFSMLNQGKKAMLRYTLWLLLMFGMASLVSAQSAPPLFDETVHNFGVVPGQVLVHPFRIVNRTNETRRISSVTVSCGCTSAHALQNVLAPGQETAIVAQMDMRRWEGFKRVYIYVRFDLPQFDEVRLEVQSTRRSDLTFAPEGLDFGKVKHGAGATVQMNVGCTGQIGLTKVIGVESKSSYVLPKVQVLQQGMGEVIFQVSATLRPDTPEGRWFTDVYLITNNSEMPRLRLPLTVEVDPAPASKAVPVSSTPPNTTPPNTTPPNTTPPNTTPPNTTPPNTTPPNTTPPNTTPPNTTPPNTTPPNTTPPNATPPNTTPPGAAIKTTPNIALGDVKAGIDSERKVILRSTQPFRITSIQSADREILVQPVSSDSKTVHVLTVTIHANQPGQLIRMIRVRTDMDNQKEVEFNAQAKIVP